MSFRRGLVVGKFCPLHRGHELLIRRALAACKELVILSYTQPEYAGCEAQRRERWFAELFPQARSYIITAERLRQWFAGRDPCVLPANDAPAQEHRRFCARFLHEVAGTGVDAVFTSEDYGDGFADELTVYFRSRFPGHPRVHHVAVDPARIGVPISASVIRADVHAHRAWLSPAVYADFVERICLLGGESSGKSTLAAALARRLDTVHAGEYGRELWIERAGALAYDDLLHIARSQVEAEARLAREAKRYLVCDTSPLTTLYYCLDLFGRAEPELERLAQRRYHLALLCAPDFPFVQDGTRRDDAFRHAQHRWYAERLAQAGLPWIEVCGPVAQRIAAVERALGRSAEGRPQTRYRV